MDMRNLLAAAGVAISLFVTGPVLAQSQHGGYLGINPRAPAPAAGRCAWSRSR
jgi:hypothetical protein